MKNTPYLILTVLAAAIAGYFMYSDCKGSRYDADITLAMDRTGSYVPSVPDKEAIKQAFQVHSELWKGARFQLMSLSDVDLNRSYEAKIEPECKYFGNIYQRKKEAAEFSKQLNVSIDKLLSEPIGRPSSSLFIPISKELARLSKSDAKRKILIVYSDLVEESSVISFSNQKTLAMLKQNPDSAMAILNKEAPLPSLNGIEIFVIFQATNSAESTVFRIVSGFYKTMLEQKGARVTIGANLIL